VIGKEQCIKAESALALPFDFCYLLQLLTQLKKCCDIGMQSVKFIKL
jgi:hypothetical protein